MKKAAFVLYTWGSTALFAVLIYWLATIPNLQTGPKVTDDLIKVIFRMVLYAIFFILLYRSIILTMKNTVSRLASYRSKGEETEDAEFVLIIETLAVIVCIISCVLFSFFEEHAQLYVAGRNGNETFLVEQNGIFQRSETVSSVAGTTYIGLSSIGESTKDILISTMAALLTGMVVYSMPVIGEFEVALKHKLQKEFKDSRKKK